MPDVQTPNYNLTKPEVGGSTDTWGGKLNANADIIDSEMAKAVKNDASEPANAAPTFRLGGFVFSLDGTAPADPADPETRDLIITCNGAVVLRIGPTDGGLSAKDLTAKDTV